MVFLIRLCVCRQARYTFAVVRPSLSFAPDYTNNIILVRLYFSLSIQNAKLGEKTKLEVFPFVNAQHLSDIGFTFIWKREACDRCEGTENELKVTAVDRTVCYRCKVSKNGTEYFTSYHFLKGCKFIYTLAIIEWLHTC